MVVNEGSSLRRVVHEKTIVFKTIVTFFVCITKRSFKKNENDPSLNAYMYCRWGLMTITTVGYDLNPKTLLGKLIGKHILKMATYK